MSYKRQRQQVLHQHQQIKGNEVPKQLISSDEAVEAKCQHNKPCSDCPWARTALKGWLGGVSVGDWIKVAHNDQKVDCHTLNGSQCAGLAIYRANVCKLVRGDALKLGVNRETVFSNPTEFINHHSFKGN